VMPKRVNQTDGQDLVLTSAANYYEGVTQKEAEAFYNAKKNSKILDCNFARKKVLKLFDFFLHHVV
ncbi:hypothetical protein EZS27_030422, partial [termite gut metagenome]